jgi:hypothetical protein
MDISIDDLWSMPVPALVGAYADARRRFVDKKFARDTSRARLDWMRGKAFVNGAGSVTERRAAVDTSEELGRKGQELREMTRDLDLHKVDVDIIAMILRLRGASVPAAAQHEAAAEAEADREDG